MSDRSEPGPHASLDVDSFLRAVESGLLVPAEHERSIHRMADLASEVVGRMADRGLVVMLSPGSASHRAASDAERVQIASAGDAILAKMVLLVNALAQIKGQVVDLAGTFSVLCSYESGRRGIDSVYAHLHALAQSARQPYVLVSATGSRRGSSDPDPQIGFPDRSLALDDVRGVLWAKGSETSLRRLTVVRRCLLLFALSPGSYLSKAKIIRAIWNDRARDMSPESDRDRSLADERVLFTTIKRARDLLGDPKGSVLHYVSGGYRFVPPGDFVCRIDADHAREIDGSLRGSSQESP